MKLFSLLAVLLFSSILSGCEDKLNKLTQEELLIEAQEHYKKKDYEAAIRFWEHFELRFPGNSQIADIMYARAIAYFEEGAYGRAAGVFEVFIDRYPLHDKKIEAQEKIFYCFYNQITRYDRDYSLIEKSIYYGREYGQIAFNNKIFDEAMLNLYKFVMHYSLNWTHRSLDNVPKLWIQICWLCENMIRNHPEHPETAEAYYRLIEFLSAQNSYGARKDARELVNKMKEYHANTIWYIMAIDCIDKEKDIISEEIFLMTTD